MAAVFVRRRSLTFQGHIGIMKIMGRSGHILIICALIALAVFLTFMPALANDFTNWDDQEMVYGNPHIIGLNPAALLRIFTQPYNGPYVPLTILSYAIEYKFFRLNPFVFHLTNILLHVANVLLVFLLMRLLLKDFWAAALIALLFGLHPLRVESVAWVTERKDVLSSFFFLSALLVFARYRLVNRRLLSFALPVLYVLAALAKPMALTLPFVLLLIDYLLDGRLDRPTARLALILGILALPIIAVNIHTQIRQTDTPPFHLVRYFLLGSRNLVWYAAKVLMPVGLSPCHPYPAHFIQRVPAAYYFAPPLLAACAAFILWSRRDTRVVLFGALFYFVMILPVSQYIPIAGPVMAAERYTYLPSLGIVFCIGAALVWLDKRMRRVPLQFILTTILAVILFALAARSNRLCRVWQNSITLWNHVLQKYPDNSLALNNRGRAFSRLGHYSLAIRDYDRAILADPQYELPYYNRAVAYEKMNDYDQALADYARALEIKPNLAIAYESRGALLSHLGRYEPAIADLDRAVKLDATMDVAFLDRGFVYFNLEQYEQALADYDRALALDPNYPETYLSRGDVFFVRGNYVRAIADYTKAVTLNPGYDEAYYNRAVAYKMTGEYDRALADYNRVLELNPVFAKALNNRGNLYLSAGAYERAIADYDRALRIDPAYAEALYNRATALYDIREYQRAWSDIMNVESLGYHVDPGFKADLARHIPGH